MSYREGLSVKVVVDVQIQVVELDPQAAEKALRDDQYNQDDAQLAYLARRASDECGDAEPYRKQSHDHAKQAMAVFCHHIVVFQPTVRIYGSVGKRPIEKCHARSNACREAARVEQECDPDERSQAEPKEEGLVLAFLNCV